MAHFGLDPTFGAGGTIVTDQTALVDSERYRVDMVDTLALPDGKIVSLATRTSLTQKSYTTHAPIIAMPVYYVTISYYPKDVLVQRWNSDGSLDDTFGKGGSVILTGGYFPLSGTQLFSQPGGGLLVLGQYESEAFFSRSYAPSGSEVARLTSNGVLDESFGDKGIKMLWGLNAPSCIGLATNASLLVAGSGYNRGVVTSLSAAGSEGRFESKQVAFDPSGTGVSQIFALAVQPDGKIVVAGTVDVRALNSANATTDIGVARLNVDGTFDTSFSDDGKLTIPYDLGGNLNDQADAIVFDGDKIVIAGHSTQSDATANSQKPSAQLTLTRLNADGSLDTSFNGSGKYTQGMSLGGWNADLKTNEVLVLPGHQYLAVGSDKNTRTNFFAQISAMGVPIETRLIASKSMVGGVSIAPDGKYVFAIEGGICRTTAPELELVSALLVHSGRGPNTRFDTINLQFNTALNPRLPVNRGIFKVRVGDNVLRLSKATYDSKTFTLSLRLLKTAPAKGRIVVDLRSKGFVGADSQVLGNARRMTVRVTRPRV